MAMKSYVVNHASDLTCVFEQEVGFDDKRSAPHRIKVLGIQVARSRSRGRYPTIPEIRAQRRFDKDFWSSVRGFFEPSASADAAAAVPTLTVAAGFFPEPGMRNEMTQVIHDSGFSDLIYQV